MEEETSKSALPDAFVKFLDANGLDPSIYSASDSTPRYIRLKPGCESQLEEIEAEIGCKLEKVGWLPGFYSLPTNVHIANSKAYREGKIYGIDAASGAAVSALKISAGDHVLDLCAAPAWSNPRVPTFFMLNGTNHEQWVESLMMNLTIMKIDLALRIEAPPKPTAETSSNDKIFYDEWEYSNRCCLMIMRYHMEESIRDSIPETKTAKEFLEAVAMKYMKFPKLEKEHYLNLLHTTFYDGVSGVGDHVTKLESYVQKLKGLGMNLSEDFLVWLTMTYLPPQFDSIRSIYNAQENDWSVSEMRAILTKEEEDIKFRTHFVSKVTTKHGTNQKKKNFFKKGNGNLQFKKGGTNAKATPSNAITPSDGAKVKGFKGKCNFCQKFGHKKVDCRKLKAYLEKKGGDKQKETN